MSAAPATMHPDLKRFIDAVLVPALLARLLLITSIPGRRVGDE